MSKPTPQPSPKPTTPNLPPLPPVRFPRDPWPPRPSRPTFFPAAAPSDLCGHLPGEQHDEECAYWGYVATGELPPPPGMEDLLAAIRRPLITPAPVVDPALRGAA